MRTKLRLWLWLFAAAVAVAGSPLAGHAQVDMTGTFQVEQVGATMPCTMTFTQVGTALSVSGCSVEASGTIDPATGVFDLAVVSLPCNGFHGTATNGGQDFTGAFGGGGSLVCFNTYAGSQHCHDGVLDGAAGEACDPGPVIDLCCMSCRLSPPATACADDGNLCTRDECNAAGTCTHPNRVAGALCDDDTDVCTLARCDGAGTCRPGANPGAGCAPDDNPCTNDICDATGACSHVPVAGLGCNDGDPCTPDDTCDAAGICRPGPGCAPCTVCAPSVGCLASGAIATGCDGPTVPGSPLAFKHGSSDGKDAASWKLTRGPETFPGDFADPRANTSYTLCAFTSPIGSTEFYTDKLLGLVLPGGATCADGRPCWKSSKNGFSYRDHTAARGITRLDLRAGAAGRTRLSLKGKGPNLTLPGLPTTLPVLVQLTADGGRCWQVEYTGARKNDSSRFRAEGTARSDP